MYLDFGAVQSGFAIGFVADALLILFPSSIGRRIRAGILTRSRGTALFPLCLPIGFVTVVVAGEVASFLPHYAVVAVTAVAALAALLAGQVLLFSIAAGKR